MVSPHLASLTWSLLSKKRKTYSTWYSQAVTHPSTNQARPCLTSVIGREPVFSKQYGRRQGKDPCDSSSLGSHSLLLLRLIEVVALSLSSSAFHAVGRQAMRSRSDRCTALHCTALHSECDSCSLTRLREFSKK